MKKMIASIAMALGCGLGAAGAVADTYPSRPIRMLVPYAAGGTTDIMARALQETMHKELGQIVVVENKPGAAGSIGRVAVPALRDLASSSTPARTRASSTTPAPGQGPSDTFPASCSCGRLVSTWFTSRTRGRHRR